MDNETHRIQPTFQGNGKATNAKTNEVYMHALTELEATGQRSLNSKSKEYRKGVGIMLINADGMVFAGQRIDCDVKAWQMPQRRDRRRRKATRVGI